MTDATRAFSTLLAAYQKLHAATPALRAFCPCPEAPQPQPVTAFDIPAAALMQADRDLIVTPATAPLRDAFIAAGPFARWRETYKGSRLGPDFMDRFACYCLIGDGGPFTAPGIAAYVVYMPPGLYYPYHQHPAEEIYFILAGAAEFLCDGQAAKTLGPGDHVIHPANAPHATRTADLGMMALVLWRNHFDTAPVLTYPEGQL